VCLRFSWRYQLREFKSEFRVVAVDMRGYGESDLLLSTDSYRYDYLVTDVKDIVEYLGKGMQEKCMSAILSKLHGLDSAVTMSQVKNKLAYHT